MNTLRPSTSLALIVTLCSAISAGAQTPPPAGPAPFGGPLAGLTAAQAALYNEGSSAFATVETPASGLGPIFNGASCVECHQGPAPGGWSPHLVTRFGREANGVFDPLSSQDGTLLHAKAIAPVLLEKLPSDANVTAQRLTTPLFGDGLIEAIPDSEIIAAAAGAKPYGIHGSVAYVEDLTTGQQRVGRFGWKAQHATLLDFAADALNNEVGITNRLFPKADAPDGDETLLAKFVSPTAPIEDQPNTAGLSEIDTLTYFMRYLAAPPAHGQSAAAKAGQQLFASVGCAVCHTPSYTTGSNAVAALSNKTVNLYSDLLLHDMGALGDGIAQAAADQTQMRTAPLWGVSARARLLHDGRATTLQQAVTEHAGEAAQVVSRYEALSANQQQELIAFLSTL